MNAWINNLIENSIQCWGCGVFDRLIQLVSGLAAGIYTSISQICILLFSIMFAAFVFNAFWQNIKGGASDPMLSKSVQKVFINSLICLTLLSTGVLFPRVITTALFEPVASITTFFSQSMINMTPDQVNEKVTYEPIQMDPNGMYRPQFRDKVIQLMKTTVTQFQSYVKLGVLLMKNAFSWQALLSDITNIIGNICKHILFFFIGLFLTWEFIKLFLKYCFYFADTVIAMALFAMFFPISLTLMAFKEAEHVPAWIGKLGGSLGTQQIKKLINSIVTLGSAVIGYTVIMVIIGKFFSAPDVEASGLVEAITTGEIYEESLNMENLTSMTLFTFLTMLFILKYVFAQIPEITKMILSAFSVEVENTHSEKLGNFAKESINNMKDGVVNLKNIITKKKTGTGAAGGASSGGTKAAGTGGTTTGKTK